MVQRKDEYWAKGSGRSALQLLDLYRATRRWRPTVVALVANPADEFLIVRRNTKEADWAFVQGEIESYDIDPVEAGLRELSEEAGVEDHMVADTIAYLGHTNISYPAPELRVHDTGYTEGGLYVCVGFQLNDGFNVTITTPAAEKPPLLEYRWCAHHEAIELLRSQPGTALVTESGRKKCEQLLIPAINTFFRHSEERQLLAKIL